MLIRLDEHYTKYANGISEHEVTGPTIEQGMRELMNRYPQLLVNVQDNDWEVGCESSLQLNDEYITDVSITREELPASSVVTFSRDIPTGESAVFQAIAGVILIIVAVVVMVVGVLLVGVTGGTSLVFAAYVFKGLVSIGIGLIIGAIVTAIMDAFFTPDLPGQMSPSLLMDSVSYSFEGARNTTAIGTAIPVVYGTHRVGGHWLNIYTTHEEERKIINDVETSVHSSYLYGQLGMCEGEIAGISDVMINRLPLNFYDEVTTIPDGNYIRLGEPVQSPMADFTYTQNSVSIGRKISVANPPISAVPVNYTSATPVYGVVEVELNIHGDYARTTIKRGFYSPSYGITQYEIDQAYYNDLYNSTG